MQDLKTLQYRTDDYKRLSVLLEIERVVNQRNESDKLNPSHNHILRSSNKKNEDLVRWYVKASKKVMKFEMFITNSELRGINKSRSLLEGLVDTDLCTSSVTFL